MEQYAIYLRKSRADIEAESRGEGETLARHRAALRAFAQRRGLNVVKEYSELVTGDSIAARPQMQLLLDDVKKGLYAGVIVNDVDRLGRGDSIDQEIIKYAFIAGHCLIITPTRDINPASPSDEDMLDFSLFFARYEYRKISQRLMQGRIRSAESGNYIHSRIPFGYRQVKNGKQITLEPNPDTAPIVKMMFALIANRDIGCNRLTTKLNEMGIKTTRGYQFYPNTVKQILKNPVYIGTNIWGKTKTVVTIENGKKVKRPVTTQGAIVTENAHPAIVSKEVFDAVQRRFAEANLIPRNTNNKMLSNPLAGLIRCSKCGKVMRAENSRRGKSLQCLTFGCTTVGTPVHVVESELLEILKGWCADYAKPPEDQPKEDTERVEVLQRQLQTINTRLAKARELVEIGVYSPAEYAEQKNMLTSQANAIEKEMAEKTLLPVSQTINLILPTVKTVLEAYEYAENATEKNRLLKTIIEKVDYEKTTRARGRQSPTISLKLVVYPKLCI